MTDRLQEFGHNFQIKSVVCLMTKPNFIEQILDILDESHYDNDSLKWIVKEAKEYFTKYKTTITLDAFKVKVNEIENDVLKTTVVETLKEIYRHMESTDLDFVQDKVIDFFKNQTLKNAIVKSVDILESNGDYEKIKNLIDDAMKAGTERNIGHDYIEDIEVRYSEMARETIEMGAGSQR